MARNEHRLRQIETRVAALLPKVREGMARQERRDFLVAIGGEIMSEDQGGSPGNEYRTRFQALNDFDKQSIKRGLLGLSKFFDCPGLTTTVTGMPR